MTLFMLPVLRASNLPVNIEADSKEDACRRVRAGEGLAVENAGWNVSLHGPFVSPECGSGFYTLFASSETLSEYPMLSSTSQKMFFHEPTGLVRTLFYPPFHVSLISGTWFYEDSSDIVMNTLNGVRV